MPSCSVAPSSTSEAMPRPIARSASLSGAGLCSGSGSSDSTSAAKRLMCSMPSPWLRGMCGLTWAIRMRAESAAARATSTEMPSVQ